MPRAEANGVEIEYETSGDPSDPALLLIMGFTAQLIAWDERLCSSLAGRGRFVIRFDNRDAGLSSHLDGIPVDIGAVIQALLGAGDDLPPAPYTLRDMALDAIGLLDAIGIDRAHIVGASMGGMIAQTIAIEHPRRLLTLTSVMSSTGEREYGQATAEASAALLTPPPQDRDEAMDRAAAITKVFASPRYFDEWRVRELAGAAFDRAFYPEGATRQLAAVMASGSRADQLRNVSVPTLVIHGRCDTLIDPSGGQRTAEVIPGANLLLLGDMGHDLPEPLWPLIVDAIIRHQEHELA